MINPTRTEHDSLGDVSVPKDAYYGAQTQRGVDNFPISGKGFPPKFIRTFGLVKWAAAKANRELKRFESGIKSPLSVEQIDALIVAAREVADGKLADQFPVDIYQTGSGTSTNMNVNEVISNRAIELVGGNRFLAKKAIHPNDHVNLGQSTNDVFPTVIHVAASQAIHRELIPALQTLATTLESKAKEWSEILKIGRTHLADATPLTLGQEFGGFARQIRLSIERAEAARDALLELPIGGTAVGTGINTHPKFASNVCTILAKETGLEFTEARDHFEASAQRDALVSSHGGLKSIAVSLFTVANNIRWLGSGPRCGFHEVSLPDKQPGSSIMPGKVNPVMSESMMQVAARVIGNDHTITFAGATGGQFQLHVMMPVMAVTMLESIDLLVSVTRAFTDLCVVDMQANPKECEAGIEKSLSLVTALVPLLGYEKSAALAKEAMASGKTIRELCVEQKVLPIEQLKRALDARQMTHP